MSYIYRRNDRFDHEDPYLHISQPARVQIPIRDNYDSRRERSISPGPNFTGPEYTNHRDRPTVQRRKKRVHVQDKLQFAHEMLEDYVEEQVLNNEGIDYLRPLISRESGLEGPKRLSEFPKEDRMKICPNHGKQKFCVCSPEQPPKKFIK